MANTHLANQIQDARGVYKSVFTPEQRTAIVVEALTRLADGATTEEVATPYGITGRTLRKWLVADCRDDAEQARAMFAACELEEAYQALLVVTEPIPLAQARERLKHWQWIAERRCPRYFGSKQGIDITHEIGPNLAKAMTDALSLRRDALGEYLYAHRPAIEAVDNSDTE